MNERYGRMRRVIYIYIYIYIYTEVMNPEGTCVIAANIMLVGDEEHKCGHWDWLQLPEAGKAGRSA